MVLTPDQLVAVTKKKRPTAQARVLRALGVPFVPRPDDGTLLVSEASINALLGSGVIVAAANDEAPAAVDIDAIKEWGRGKAARASRSK